jgi:type II pantothenate kinase
LIAWLNELISTSAAQNRVSVDTMRSTVKVMVTGGGAYMYYDRLRDELEVEVKQEEEMECLITGLGFVARVPEEVFWFSDALVYKVSHSAPAASADGEEVGSGDGAGAGVGSADGEARDGTANGKGPASTPTPAPTTTLKPAPQPELERPSPTPPQYSVTFAPIAPVDDLEEYTNPNFPCLLVNIGSGVSIVKVDENGKFERVSGTSLGGGTLWGLLSLLTDARSFDGRYLLHAGHSPAAINQTGNLRAIVAWYAGS